jgi:hypothetical protein
MMQLAKLVLNLANYAKIQKNVKNARLAFSFKIKTIYQLGNAYHVTLIAYHVQIHQLLALVVLVNFL